MVCKMRSQGFPTFWHDMMARALATTLSNSPRSSRMCSPDFGKISFLQRSLKIQRRMQADEVLTPVRIPEKPEMKNTRN